MRLHNALVRMTTLVVFLSAAMFLIGCASSQQSAPAGTTITEQPKGALPPLSELSSPTTVIAFTWFDQDQGSTVSSDWEKASGAMKALEGFRYSAVFTALDERQSNVMALSIWDDSSAANRGLLAAEAQIPARGWAKSGVFHRIAADGNMGDSVLTSVVMVMPITSEVDSARAVADFIVANGFMRTQPGYLASSIFKRVTGDPSYGYLIAGRWTSRENLQRVSGLPEFQDLQKMLALAGQPTTYIQMH